MAAEGDTMMATVTAETRREGNGATSPAEEALSSTRTAEEAEAAALAGEQEEGTAAVGTLDELNCFCFPSYSLTFSQV